MTPLEKLFFSKIRKEFISKARGKVLEIGFGTGVNYRYYNLDLIDKIYAADTKLKVRTLENVEYIQCSVEQLPFKDNSFDTVVATLLLCSVSDVSLALSEIRRVLKSDGQYIFLEHVRPKRTLGKFFDAVNIIWGKNPSGCQLNKHTPMLFHTSNFNMNMEFFEGALYYGIAKK